MYTMFVVEVVPPSWSDSGAGRCDLLMFITKKSCQSHNLPYNTNMQNIVQFIITRYTDDGVYYVANTSNAPIMTQGDTLDELETNMKEAVELYLEDEKDSASVFTRRPAVMANFELAYA